MLMAMVDTNLAEQKVMRRILLVDDSTVDRTALARLLTRQGYEVLSASGGREALVVLNRQAPDLIVLDVAMPDIDGLKLLEILHENEVWRALPVIMLTGVSDTLTIQRAEQLGAREYMVKAAFSVSQLLQTIAKTLSPVN